MSELEQAEHEPAKAPKLRRAEAGAVDAAVAGVVALGGIGVRILRRAGGDAPSGGLSEHGPALARAGSLIGPLAALLSEQLRSPGQRIAGLRTVDRRTGERPQLWRSLLVVGFGIGAAALREHLSSPAKSEQSKAEKEADRERFRAAVADARSRYGEGTPGFAGAIHEYYREHRVAAQPDMRRVVLRVALGVGASRVQRRLKERLSPTVVVLAPKPESDS